VLSVARAVALNVAPPPSLSSALEVLKRRLSRLRALAAMAEIKTGIFAKNVQKRLSRAQEKVRV